MSRLELIVGSDEEGRVTLKCPGVGYWRQAPVVGHLVSPGQSLGILNTLGRDQVLVAPTGARGLVLECPSGTHGSAVAFGDPLMVLGEAIGAADEVDSANAGSDAAAGDVALVFRSSSSGRFYVRPAPDKPPFVSEGDIVEEGQTVFLLEVMKTFSRVAYGGDGLPARARVVSIGPADGDDLEAGQVVLQLEPVEE